jgi:hypothetical protein
MAHSQHENYSNWYKPSHSPGIYSSGPTLNSIRTNQSATQSPLQDYLHVQLNSQGQPSSQVTNVPRTLRQSYPTQRKHHSSPSAGRSQYDLVVGTSSVFDQHGGNSGFPPLSIETNLSSGKHFSSFPLSDTTEHIYSTRPTLPPTAEEISSQLLDKLEQAGRVPSKEKFRRMACNVRSLPQI